MFRTPTDLNATLQAGRHEWWPQSIGYSNILDIESINLELNLQNSNVPDLNAIHCNGDPEHDWWPQSIVGVVVELALEYWDTDDSAASLFSDAQI